MVLSRREKKARRTSRKLRLKRLKNTSRTRHAQQQDDGEESPTVGDAPRGGQSDDDDAAMAAAAELHGEDGSRAASEDDGVASGTESGEDAAPADGGAADRRAARRLGSGPQATPMATPRGKEQFQRYCENTINLRTNRPGDFFFAIKVPMSARSINQRRKDDEDTHEYVSEFIYPHLVDLAEELAAAYPAYAAFIFAAVRSGTWHPPKVFSKHDGTPTRLVPDHIEVAIDESSSWWVVLGLLEDEVNFAIGKLVRELYQGGRLFD